jgi:hypothetical protein
MSNWSEANPTTPGAHNHLGGRPPARDPANPRGDFDRVFGVDAPLICRCPIEVGSGARSTEWQLAQHLVRIRSEDGDAAARALFHKLREAAGVNQRSLDVELVAVGFMAEATAGAAKMLDEYQPGGSSN